ncbi:hypothetical protein MYU51_001785 [Penicillium brevicompactum]|uniref:uncharacterized protein n=1 Tax=Penicillium brevicompactum TaxID=5074 RepID=UPI002540AD5F|nr:uncharacterized protein N7506_009831 [Penicillium brevicompactum]KAJ5326729.1 hypothetical protein N7506_009831 [Penicillium brevicompactum]
MPDSIRIPSRPETLDTVRLRNIELPLTAPEAWHREGKPQPCTATLKLSYSSIVGAADTDDVSLTLDYGKLFRRLQDNVHTFVHPVTSPEHPARHLVNLQGGRCEEMNNAAFGQDPRVTAGIVASAGLDILDETAAAVICRDNASISAEYAECEVELRFPKAILRAEHGLWYRSVTAFGYTPADLRCPVVLQEEYRIDGIRCYAILGVNSHERLEKQAVIVGLRFQGPGQQPWGSKVVETYQAVTRAVAEKVDETTFQSVESLATFIAHIVTVDFGNESVTVKVEKPSALAFVELSGVEITRSKAFFDTHRLPEPRE